MKRRRDLPFGTILHADGVVFRLFAPAAQSVALRIAEAAKDMALRREDGGWFTATVAEAQPGTLYHFVIDGTHAVPDPASRFQPQDVNGPSEVVDPAAFDWSDEGWSGRPWHETVIYELHLGTFTRQGTYRAAAEQLPRLKQLGITAIELMPLAEFAGRRNWGYDGVLPFAPESSYGRPEELKALICAAHRLGLMVFVDVVYNHFGPEGNYLSLYAPSFFSERHTDWGQALDFAGNARRYFIENALYWLIEYHVDGLRFDAVHAIEDAKQPHFLEELAAAARSACPGRHIHLVLENDRNEARYLQRRSDGAPRFYDAQWNDDFHHVMHVILTGETDGYYADYAQSPVAILGRCLAQGFAYQGEHSLFRDKSRGEPSAALPPLAFVNSLQNHDQIGNRAFGERLITLAPRPALIAAIAIQLLAPSPPLLFMGEELGATAPFLFFCDFSGGLADAVREGRRREFARFPAFASLEARARIPDPLVEETFHRSSIVPALDSPDEKIAQLYHELLHLRREQIIPRLVGPHPFHARYEVKDRAMQVDWELADGSTLVLAANLSDKPSATATLPEGRVIWGCASQDSLPPWGVIWSLAEASTP